MVMHPALTRKNGDRYPSGAYWRKCYMSYLSNEDRADYADPRKCKECEGTITNSYCNRCDVFYPLGHKRDCKQDYGHDCDQPYGIVR